MEGDDDIAGWATTANDGGTTKVFWADAMAREFSEVGLLRDDAPEFSPGDDGHAEAPACARAALD